MWYEILESGKCKFTERYKDYMTGKQKYVSVTLSKYTNANEKKANQVLQDKIKKKQIQQNTKDVTLSVLVDDYLAYQKKTVKASTWKRNSFSCKKITKMLGKDTLVKRLNAPHILKAFSDEKITVASKKDLRKRLIAMLNWGYKNDYISDLSYISKIEPYSHDERSNTKYLEREELKAVLTQLKDQWTKTYLIAQFLALTGLRFGEFCALNDGDIDLKTRSIRITKTYDLINRIVTPPKTPESNRELYIQDELKPIITQIRVLHKEEMLLLGFRSSLFLSEKGSPIQNAAFNKSFGKAVQKITGRRLTAHSLRHTHTSLLAEQGMSLEEISRRLGHRDSTITRDIYLHVTDKMKQQEQEKLKKMKLL
ncbi:integrase [Aequitasia blattaphilus]|uniref:Site-specific integrase n=1 Tax=Aequitasia blattaphilus TaxID=2949332 RepID=A0ABT1EFC9_9FIRM|nr:site-specific integrase [Aequitasia blattaphilus]MCP1103637.1 site-specific integrase [Aequitasia blattaphilus]MCR8616277.1 site-specific integrase [Aequitasia blattaphilus]